MPIASTDKSLTPKGRSSAQANKTNRCLSLEALRTITQLRLHNGEVIFDTMLPPGETSSPRKKRSSQCLTKDSNKQIARLVNRTIFEKRPIELVC